MKVFIEKENKSISLKFSGTVKALVRKLKLNPQAVLVAKNNELATEQEMLKDCDEVKILSVISGG